MCRKIVKHACFIISLVEGNDFLNVLAGPKERIENIHSSSLYDILLKTYGGFFKNNRGISILDMNGIILYNGFWI